ncbi:ATP-binding protein [Pantoea sp. Bo_2]|uniref:ATP-binding protein n=1 Tax=Candidatus Pantoea gossypiicola TaxID=2608008 RepID=A0AB34CLI5_9GAMM|nr:MULTISPECIES: ATP-binding protein [Pantoea]KAA5933137.1 ATP-binding protein [Pantoea sp. VH_8]KAA5937924.1 ATP-binding protein [Pantoea sp. VH_4]KAA5950289.1 ATP-binding protein [Pantoea sp. VH_3]KAA5955662.1 ATP-binding protein [Pantoea sp. VH_25]KAA5960175.1 ATP-binding protein [Pantoea sp. VH_24]
MFMTSAPATLHLLCGKMASGKSTLAAQLGTLPGYVVISEDQWLAALYQDEMHSVADYVRVATKLRKAITPHLVALLKAGVSVVLDFPANTRANRDWLRSVIEASSADHRLHYLDVPDALCKSRLHARNQGGEHAFAATDEQFALITRYFEPPHEAEGFNLVRHG